MKVVIFAPLPKGNKIGGIAQWSKNVIDYYQSLMDSSIDLSVIPSNNRILALNRNKLKRIADGLRNLLGQLSCLKNALRVESPQICHFTSSASLGLFRDLLIIHTIKRAKTNTKTIIHFRFGRIPELRKAQNWEWRLLKKVVSRVDRCIVIDIASYRVLIDEGYNNVSLLPNPIAPDIETIIHFNNPISREDNRILFVGHIIPTKGIYELIDACLQIPNIKLEMVGPSTNSIKEHLLELASVKNEKDWFEIIDNQPHEYVVKEILKCAIFALPTYTEGFPNVIIESMACACPIITTPVGAIPEMLNISSEEKCGICVSPKNVEQLKQAIELLLSDRKLALKLGQNAQKRANEQYSMSAVWQQMVSIWEHLLINDNTDNNESY